MRKDKKMRAISIRQPYAEEILLEKKKFEYRSTPTNIRGRVYIYASLQPGSESSWKKVCLRPGDLPTGLIVGTVEITDCKYSKKKECYAYTLARPKRLRVSIKPKNRPQPRWFFPFR